MTKERLLAKTLRAEITAHYCNPNALRGQPRPTRVDSALDDQTCSRARASITSWSNYAPTPLHPLPALAHEIGIGQLLYKDEATRFGLGSFKALGGAYGVLHCVAQEISVRSSTPTDIDALMTAARAQSRRSVPRWCVCRGITENLRARQHRMQQRTTGCSSLILPGVATLKSQGQSWPGIPS